MYKIFIILVPVFIRVFAEDLFLRVISLRFNKIAIQGTPQMAVDKEAICLSRVYSYYPKCNFPLFMCNPP